MRWPWSRKTIPGNAERLSGAKFGAQPLSVQLATTMALANNTFSPMANGVHDPAHTQARGYAMVRGYGVHRMGWDLGPIQNFYGAVARIADPTTQRLGMNQGVAGQPGLPQAGMNASGLAALDVGGLPAVGWGG